VKYSTAVAFRRALEERMKTHADGDPARIGRDRKRVVFDRLLARLAMVAPDAWVLKGGFALDLRLGEAARTTRDVDLAWRAGEEQVLNVLIEAAACDLGDFFVFAVERGGESPERFGGALRFHVTVSLAGRPFEAFVIDVALDDNPDSATDSVTTPDLLGFAGIEPVVVPAVSLATQLAEKLHAYTRIYEGGRVSSRVKDLIDLVLIAGLFDLDGAAVLAAVEEVFAGRASHAIPPSLPVPPTEWRAPYRHLATTLGLDVDLDAGYRAAATLVDPVLNGNMLAGTWHPDARAWTP